MKLGFAPLRIGSSWRPGLVCCVAMICLFLVGCGAKVGEKPSFGFSYKAPKIGFSKEIKRLEKRVNSDSSNLDKDGMLLQLAVLYSHPENKRPNYSAALAISMGVAKRNPRHPKKEQVEYFVGLCRKIRDLQKSKGRYRGQSRKLTKRTKALKKKNEACQQANEELQRVNKEMEKTLEKLKKLDFRLEEMKKGK